MVDEDKERSESADSDAPEKAAPARRARPSAAKQADARRNPEQLKRNQERLGVGSDHRTEAMKKGKRGTFP
jgi:hypothetical protein